MPRLLNRSAAAIRIVFIIMIVFMGTASAETRPNRVAIVPFAIHSDRDMAFLRDGITDMLTSRLSWEKKVQVIGREQTAEAVKGATGTMNDIQAQIIGAKLEADYVLFGSLTIFADSVSMDAKLVDVSGAKPTLAFFNQAQGMGQVIPQINRFATDINTRVFGRAAPAPPVTLQPARPSAPGPGAAMGSYSAGRQAPQQAPEADIHAHPETLAEGSFSPEGSGAPMAGSPIGNTQVTTPSDAPIGGAFVQPEVQEVQAKFWKSRTMKVRLIGIALGDVDKDGLVEIVMADEHRVDVYRMTGGILKRAYAPIDLGSAFAIGVDVGDINGNGYAEVYISALSARRNVGESQIFEFKGNAFEPISEKSQYCYRIVNTVNRGKILLGQEYRAFANPWEQPVSEMLWINGNLEPQNNVLPDNKANVFGRRLQQYPKFA
jgi:TolB-like protein